MPKKKKYIKQTQSPYGEQYYSIIIVKIPLELP